jgi:hypothetical protein
MKTTMKVLMGAVLLTAGMVSLKAQDTIKATAEIVSSYIWRGSLATPSPTPNFQPTLAYGHGALEIGIWGSTDFVGDYKEFDPYVSYTINSSLKVTLTDYDWSFSHAKYFNYKKDETGHMFEGSVAYTGPSSLPISISLNTMFYGYDKKDTANTQAYSTYIELGYTKGAASFFFGFTPWKSMYTGYSKDLAVVNIGATLSRAIKVTSDFSLPVRATFVVNPSAQDAHLIFGITF